MSQGVLLVCLLMLFLACVPVCVPALLPPPSPPPGAHTRSISVATPSTASGGIMRFAKVKPTCLACR